jgi:hypothetical protein
MKGKFHLKEIIVNAHKSLYKDVNNNTISLSAKVIGFDVFPGLLAGLIICLGNSINLLKDFSESLLTTFSLFSGLLFSLIIVLVDKAKSRKLDLIKNDNEESKNYLKRYLNFSEQLISQISFSIILSFVVIIILLCSQLKFDNEWFNNSSIKMLQLYLSSFTLFYFSIQFIILLAVIISGMFSVFLEEIDN